MSTLSDTAIIINRISKSSDNITSARYLSTLIDSEIRKCAQCILDANGAENKIRECINAADSNINKHAGRNHVNILVNHYDSSSSLYYHSLMNDLKSQIGLSLLSRRIRTPDK